MKKAIRITAVTLSACLLAATSMFGASAKEVTFHKTAYVKGSIAGVKDADIYVVDKTDFDEADPAEKAAEQNKLSAAFDEGKMITFTGDADVLNQREMQDIVGAKDAFTVKDSGNDGQQALRGVSMQKTAKGIKIHNVYVNQKNASERQADNAVVKNVSKSYATQNNAGWTGIHNGDLYNYYYYQDTYTTCNQLIENRTFEVYREDRPSGGYYWAAFVHTEAIAEEHAYTDLYVIDMQAVSDAPATLIQSSPSAMDSNPSGGLVTVALDKSSCTHMDHCYFVNKIVNYTYDNPPENQWWITCQQTKRQLLTVAQLYYTSTQRLHIKYYDRVTQRGGAHSGYTAGRTQNLYFGFNNPNPSTPSNPKA